MFENPALVQSLAERIERTYRLRRPAWNPGCSAQRVWAAAAARLLEVHDDDPSIPLDPELFVAAQEGVSSLGDPWSDLTQDEAARRYRDRVQSIVSSLRAELRAEVFEAELRIILGQEPALVLILRDRTLSPLGRFIVARRAGLCRLAERIRPSAAAQHRACPLYRYASRTLIPPEFYPVADSGTGPATALPRGRSDATSWRN